MPRREYTALEAARAIPAAMREHMTGIHITGIHPSYARASDRTLYTIIDRSWRSREQEDDTRSDFRLASESNPLAPYLETLERRHR